MTSATPHTWTFFRAGGLDQVLISTADDLRHLDQLDLKLWVALSCPVKGLEFDTRTLELLDTDKDGRVRVPELLAAVKWTCGLLKDPARIMQAPTSLPLDAIDDGSAEGKSLLASARQVLINLGKPDGTAISVEDTSDTVRIFSETVFNGDGVVQAGCAKDDATRAVIEEIIALYGSDPDRSGKPGITKAKADAFFAELRAFDAWWRAGEAASGPGTGVLPLGEATPAAHTAYAAVKGKITDWFMRCRLATYDGRAAAPLNRAEADFQAIAAKDLSIAGDEIAALPLQQVGPGRSLDLGRGINPAWTARIEAFAAAVMRPLLGGAEGLDLAQWEVLQTRFAPYESWMGAKQGAKVEGLGIARVRAILDAGAEQAIQALIDADLAIAPEVASIDALDRLVRYYRDLGVLVTNFVSFADFYDRKPPPPVFMAGTLFIDQRRCDLCIRVDDIAAHSALAALGRIYIAYVACSRPSGEKMNLAVAVTQGDADYLMVGRNGLFYDRKGRDWDANVVKIIDHPISIQQAFWSPYKKIGKMISDTVEKITGGAEKAVLDKASTSVNSTATAATAGKPPEKPKIDTGMLAAIGIAATSLISGLSALAAAIFGLPLWKIPLVVAGVVLAISGPSMIIAFLKLRQRTLGPVLEGNGWAINGRVKINIPLGTSLTSLKRLPTGARRLLDDPFEDKAAKRRFRLTLATIVLLGLAGGFAYLAWESAAANQGDWRFWNTWSGAAAAPAADATAAAVKPAP